MVSERERRICEAAISALEGSPLKRLSIVALNDVLFHADLIALRDLGETITGSEYLALPHGPTITNAEARLVRPLVALGWAELETSGQATSTHMVRAPDTYERLTQDERRIAYEVGAKRASFASARSSERAQDDDCVGIGVPINMMLALQRLDDDPWLTSSLSASESAELASAVEAGATTPW